MKTLGFDTETHLFTQYDRAPKIVCGQFVEESGAERILTRADMRPVLGSLLLDSELVWIGCSIRYDFACMIREWPELTTSIFELYESGRVIDVGVYEKFLMLGRFGYTDSAEMPDGSVRRLSYSLGAIAHRRLGLVLAGKDKDDEEDSWRLRFAELDGLPIEQYPKEAIEYALDDVRVLHPLLRSQLEDAERYGIPLAPARLTIAADFALYLMTCQGVDIDPAERERVEQWIQSELTDERLEPLYASGILRRPQPSRPHLNQMKKVQDCLLAGITDREGMKARGVRFTEEKPASVDTKLLREIIAQTAEAVGVPLQLTDTKLVSTSDEFLQELEDHDVRLAAYTHRQRLSKIFTTELPRIRYARVHPNYDALKETGRTSSWDPNIQNVDPRVRGCYVPPPGWLFLSVDYAGIELVTLAQKLVSLFGKSLLADLINAGVDFHGYLGARLAWELDRAGFVEHCVRASGAAPAADPMGLYEGFRALKKGDDAAREYYRHWRTFAKPVDLGYPGGLGARTFVTFAKGTYGVRVTEEQAAQFKQIWFETLPEMHDYFEWVSNECATGEDDYAYVSPAGMVRNHCTYCACANGAALQTPAAEGGKLALWTIVRKCMDPSLRSILYGCRPWAWIHDQIILSVPDDGWAHERAGEVESDMISSMRQVIPDVAVRTEACLMRRWAKEAESKYDAQGRLIPWN